MTEFGDQELINEFLVESYDNLDQLDQDFVALEQNPSDGDLLSRIFRCVHTLKGTCGFLGFSKLESIAHVGEDLLSELRDGERTLTPELASALLTMVDAVREVLAHIERDGSEGGTDYSSLIAQLETLQDEKPADPDPVNEVSNADVSMAHLASKGGVRLGELLVKRGDAAPDEIARALLKQLEGDPRRLGEILVESQIVGQETLDAIVANQKRLEPKTVGEWLMHAGAVDARDIADALRSQLEGDSRAVGEILEEHGAATKEDVTEALAAQEEQRDAAQLVSSIADNTVRVDVELLDGIMRGVGELVLARNDIVQFVHAHEDADFKAACERLNSVTTALQKGVLKTRMQPIGSIWNKFPRIVRDLSQSLDKKIRIEMEGEDTQLDTTVLDAIKDPLTHIVRNCVDHGFETPVERVAANKPEEGRLSLRAYLEAGHVNIEIADDGKGVDVAHVRSKAVERNAVTHDHALRMNRHEALNLIFAAGVSTADEVTSLSGRGVGMDVVHTNIERIGGRVSVLTEAGVGTTLRIRLPLTQAIIPALPVTAAGERYLIPQDLLLESIRLDDRQGIEFIHSAPVFRLRGSLLPLVHLGEQLGFAASGLTPGHAEHDRDGDGPINIVVLQAEDVPFGLVVDGVCESDEILVKPLGDPITSIPVFAGAALLGDGNVALVLDVVGIAQRANVLANKAQSDMPAQQSRVIGGKENILLFRAGGVDRMAMNLSEVDRLEEFSAENVEMSNTGNFVRYRDFDLPLISVADYLPGHDNTPPTEAESTPQEKIQVVVYTNGVSTFGFHVDEIRGVVNEAIVPLDTESCGPVRFAAAVRGDRTEFLDPDALIALAATNTKPRYQRDRAEIDG